MVVLHPKIETFLFLVSIGEVFFFVWKRDGQFALVAVFLFYFVFYPANGEKESSRQPHLHVFSYMPCVDLTQMHSQSSVSWRVLQFP